MVDDVDQLLGEQPYVDAMQDRAHRRHGKVGLQVFLVVPGEGADAVSRADAQLSQRGGQTAHAFAYLRVAGAPHMVAGVGRHLARRVDAFAVLEDAANGQREIGYGAAVAAGVDWVVAGTSIFHTVNPRAAFEEMRQLAREASTAPV